MASTQQTPDEQQDPLPDPNSDYPPSRNSLHKILCCSKVNHHKTPIPNAPEIQRALDIFKLESGGALPHEVHDTSKKVYWWAYKEIYCVVSNGSRGSKKCKGINFYGISITHKGREIKKVTLIPDSAVLAGKLEVVGARKAKDVAGGRDDACLLREEGGMELSCKKHLDTIYTVYRVHYQGIRATRGLGKLKEEDPLAESRRKHMQSRKEWMAKPERGLFEKETAPEELYGSKRQDHINATGTDAPMFMFPSDDIYEPAKLIPEYQLISQLPTPAATYRLGIPPPRAGNIGSAATSDKTLDGRPVLGSSTTGFRTPVHTPGHTSQPVISPTLTLPLTRGLITPVRTPTSTPITPSERKAPSNPTGTPARKSQKPGVKMIACSRHKSRLVPETDISIDPKTGERYKTCDECRRKNRTVVARARGEVPVPEARPEA